MLSLYSRRLLVNRFNLVMSLVTMAFGLTFLLWILFTLFQAGFHALSLGLFTQMTPPPGSTGGLLNAIMGSVIMAAMGTLIGTPIGIFAGIYLAEYGSRGWLAPCTRFINDILLSAPSIVIGLFIYEIYVSRVNHFSAWAGSRTGPDCHSGSHPYDREHAEAGTRQPPRGGRCIRYTAVENDPHGDAALGPRGHHHRCAARGRQDLGRNSPVAVYRAQQPVLDHQFQCTDIQPAGRDLPVRDEPVQRLAAVGVGRRVADHARRAGAQYRRANNIPPGDSKMSAR